MVVSASSDSEVHESEDLQPLRQVDRVDDHSDLDTDTSASTSTSSRVYRPPHRRGPGEPGVLPRRSLRLRQKCARTVV